jgi:pyrimidine-specific ribonucleoside hydrolase
MSGRVPLIIDTDPALGVIHEGRPRDVDDAFAIAEALRAEDLDLRAITVTFGNAPLESALRVARELVELAGADLPVAPGTAAAIPESGLPEATAATRLLESTLEQAPARIAALGPLGNLGTLLLHRPDLAGRIEEVVIVGGRTLGRPFYLGETGPVRDFNFENDVRAARVLLESGVPVTCAGFELSSPLAMGASHLDAIAAHGTPLARRLAEGARPWLAHWLAQFPDDAGFHPWDSAAICWIRQPGLIHSEQRGWRIREVESDLRRGNPDASPRRVPWLETSTDLEGTLRFCTGFREQAESTFLDAVVEDCR